MSSPENIVAPGRPCPVCGRPAAVETRPFCSRRCADVDLQRWFAGAYSIPGSSLDPDDGGEAGQD